MARLTAIIATVLATSPRAFDALLMPSERNGHLRRICEGADLQVIQVSGRQDLNLRPPGPQPGALPDCATPRGRGMIARRGAARTMWPS
jgi:hypothetical protein